MKSIFEFKHYREFLKDALPTDGEHRGSRNRLAEALGCQKGFVSQVLSGRSHFSLEHGPQIARFLDLSEDEKEYFLLLLHRGRAGSHELEKFYDRKLKERLELRTEIKERLRSKSDLTELEQAEYYSSWIYTAIHMCLMIPELRTKQAIAAYLGAPQSKISKVLEFFYRVGLAKEVGGGIIAGPARIHLPSQSPLISRHHTNWRMQAIASLDGTKDQDLHYSLVMSISEEAAIEIRELLLNSIQMIEPVLKSAEDKTVYALNLDLFSVRR